MAGADDPRRMGRKKILDLHMREDPAFRYKMREVEKELGISAEHAADLAFVLTFIEDMKTEAITALVAFAVMVACRFW